MSCPVACLESRPPKRSARTVALFALLTMAACSAEPTGHPLNTGAIPASAKVVDKCSMLAEMACSLVSGVHGDAGLERRSACVAYVAANGTRTEMCGSVPAAQP